MTLDDFISDLQQIRLEHGGSLPVENSQGEEVSYPEYNEDEYPCVVVDA